MMQMEKERNLKVNKSKRTLQELFDSIKKRKQYKNNGHSRRKRERERNRELIQRNS